MQITIECLTGSLAGKAFYFDQAEITLGRGENVRKDIDFADTDLGVSRNHGSLIVRGNRVYLNDQSRAGTLVGGQRIQGTTHELQPEDELQLGGQSGPKVRVRFQALAQPITQPIAPAPAQSLTPPQQPVQPAQSPPTPAQPPQSPQPVFVPAPPVQPVVQNTMLQVPASPIPTPQPAIQPESVASSANQAAGTVIQSAPQPPKPIPTPAPPVQPVAQNTMLQVPTSPTPAPQPAIQPEPIPPTALQAEGTVIQPIPPAQVNRPTAPQINTLEPLRPSNEIKAQPQRPIAPAGDATVFQTPPTPIVNDVTQLQVPAQEGFQPPRAMPAPPPIQPPIPVPPPMPLDATIFQANNVPGYQAPPMPPADATQFQRPPMGETMYQSSQENNRTVFQPQDFDTGQTILQEKSFSWIPAIIVGLLVTAVISFLVWFFVFHR
jgi:pSer/pThr/pTyr-binding forkhead associated (FHA) protein